MDALEALRACGGYLDGTHVVYTSGRHGSEYLNKDAVYPHTVIVSELCLDLTWQLLGNDPAAPCGVIGPEKGGIILSQWVAYHMGMIWDVSVLAVYAEKEGDGFVLRRGYDGLVRDRDVMIVEDVLTTGGSVAKVVAAARALGCDVRAVGALFNRGGVTKEMLGVPRLVTLADVALESFPEDDCPLCRAGVPINTTVGKGREFLVRRASSS